MSCATKSVETATEVAEKTQCPLATGCMVWMCVEEMANLQRRVDEEPCPECGVALDVNGICKGQNCATSDREANRIAMNWARTLGNDDASPMECTLGLQVISGSTGTPSFDRAIGACMTRSMLVDAVAKADLQSIEPEDLKRFIQRHIEGNGRLV